MKHLLKHTLFIYFVMLCHHTVSGQSDLYWGNHYDGILKYDQTLDLIITVVPIPTHSPQRMVLNYKDGLIYWTDSEHRKIYQCDFDGKNQTPVISFDTIVPYGLAYDPKYDLIFYSDFENGQIFKYEMTNDTSILIKNNLTTPIQLQLDTLKQEVYWLDQGESVIGKVDYCGFNDSILIDTVLPFLQCFLYDFAYEKIYYSDVQLNKVFTLDLSLQSTGELDLDTLEFIREMKIDYSKNKLYWVDARLDLVFQANLDGSQQEILYDANPSKKPNRFFSILTSLEFDSISNDLYFMDLTLNKLNKVSLTNLMVDSLIISPVYWPTSIIISETSKKIFWTEGIHGQILEYSIENDFTSLIYSKPELIIMGLVLDERNNTLFICDRFNHKIYKFHSDTLQSLVDLVDLPTGIILDTFDNKLYYLVQGRANIWRSNLDGSDMIKLLNHHYIGLGTECIIDRQNGYVYWDTGNEIKRNNIEFGNDAVLPFSYKPETIFSDSIYCISGMVINTNLNRMYFVQGENLFSLNLQDKSLTLLDSNLRCGPGFNSKMASNATNLFVNESVGNPCDDSNPCTFNTNIQFNGRCGGGDTLTQDNTFIGPGNDWHQPTHWSLGITPQTCHNVIIPAPFNVQIPSNTTANCYTLETKSGATFITDGHSLLNVLITNDK